MNAADSIYRHGFARVACAVPTIRIGDPRHNAQRTIALAEQAAGPRRRAGHLPRAGAHRLQRRRPVPPGRAARRRARRDRRGRRRQRRAGAACWWSARRCVSEQRLFNCAVVVHRGRVLGVVPKSYLPNYREFYEKRQFTAARNALADTIAHRRRARAVRRRPGLRGHRPASTSPCTWRSARTCGRRSRRAPTRRWPAPRCCATCRPPTSPIGKADYRRTLCIGAVGADAGRLPVHRRRRRRVDHRPGLGRPGDHRRERRAAGRERALQRRGPGHHRRRRPGPARPGPHAHDELRRRRRRPPRARLRRCAACPSRSEPRSGARSRWSAAIERFPYVPGRHGRARRALRGDLPHPGPGPGHAAAGDRDRASS